LLGEAAVGGVVTFVVGDHQGDAGALGCLDHGVALGDGEAEWLFDQDVPAGLGGGDGDRGVAAGGQDEDGVERSGEQVAPVGGGEGDGVVAGAGVAQGLR
jgi:hypothetical protein